MAVLNVRTLITKTLEVIDLLRKCFCLVLESGRFIFAWCSLIEGHYWGGHNPGPDIHLGYWGAIRPDIFCSR